MPGRATSCWTSEARSAPASITTDPSATVRHAPASARARAAGIGAAAGSSSASEDTDGNSRSGRPSSAGATSVRSPAAAARRPVTVRAPATDTCWPSTPRTSISGPSTAPAARRPGTRRTSGASRGSAPSWRSTATGSASRSSRRRHRCTAAWRSARAVSQRVHVTASSVGVSRTTPAPPGSRSVRAYEVPSHDSTPGTARWARKAVSSAAANGARTGSRSVIAPAPAPVELPPAPGRRTGSRRRRSARSCDGDVANTSRTVSLNWRTLANPAANAMSVIGIVVVSISVRAVCARCALASASGPAPTSSASSRCR